MLEGTVLGPLALSSLEPELNGIESFMILMGHCESLNLCVFIMLQ